MYGAIIGDLAGSIYEYSQLKKVIPVYMDKIIEDNAFYSDDTILTIAILDAIQNNREYEKYIRFYIKKYSSYKPNFSPYFNNAFSPGLIKWAATETQGVSCGNWALMRISPIGYLFNTEEEIIENARLATIPSHNSNEAIISATTIALMIYYFRKGLNKDEIYKKLNIKIKYSPFKKFNTTCYETLGNCLYALYNSKTFDEAIKLTLLMGGDTDTNCAIVGSIAEAMYGIDPLLKSKAEEKLPEEFIYVLKRIK